MVNHLSIVCQPIIYIMMIVASTYFFREKHLKAPPYSIRYNGNHGIEYFFIATNGIVRLLLNHSSEPFANFSLNLFMFEHMDEEKCIFSAKLYYHSIVFRSILRAIPHIDIYQE